MKKYYLTPATLPDWSNYFSQVAVIEKNGIKTIYVAGQVGVDRHKNLVGNGELRGQLKQTFSNLQTALESVDATMANIVKMNIYVVNYQPSDAEAIPEAIRQKSKYLTGDNLTTADISLYAYTHVAEEGGFDLTKYPAIQLWIYRIASEPKYIGMN
ncbi:MAG: Rid family hydrolase [Pleurocapsa sp. MO_192.B19]|nr:Rid family hydrolase [Pleurocapsa sp. MO_192.B19]